MTIILAIDTAMTGSSVAIAREGVIISSVASIEKGVQAAQLVLHIEACLDGAALTYNYIDKIAVCVGPGGFTGIRVGLATARAIALAAEKEIVGFSSLEIMLHNAKDNAIAVLNAGRKQYYAQAQGEQVIETIEANNLHTQLKDKNIISTEKFNIEQSAKVHNPQHNAEILCLLALTQKGRTPEPLYVRAPDAKAQKKLLD